MHTNRYLKILLFVLGSLIFEVVSADAAPAGNSRMTEYTSHWTEYAKGIYTFEKEDLNSTVLVSDTEVLIMDPFYPDHARALKQEIAARFDLPVKYVVYSHAHADHIRGGTEFSDTAKFIASKSQNDRIKYSQKYDNTIVTPDITFDGEYEIHFAGRKIILRDYGPDTATGMTVMFIPQARIVAVYDIVYPKRLAFLSDGSPRRILYTLREVFKEDFDICLTAHGKPVNREEFKEFIDFMDDLISQAEIVFKDVMNNYSDKKFMATMGSITEKIDLSKYSDWGLYDTLHDANIVDTFRSIYLGY